MATGLPFGARAERAAQTRVLRAALDSIRPQRPVAAFDIDSTILVNKVRQARIVREYGQLRGDRRLAACQPETEISRERSEICHQRLKLLRGLACAFDNEPTHVNAYKRSFPEAAVVHLDTDHSRRPVEVLPEIPSIHDFVMEPIP